MEVQLDSEKSQETYPCKITLEWNGRSVEIQCFDPEIKVLVKALLEKLKTTVLPEPPRKFCTTEEILERNRLKFAPIGPLA